jgi:uncharacterized protein with HEPN domain
VKRGDAEYLAYVTESIERIERWTSGGPDAVLADEVLREAVLHRLETLSEAVIRLSDALKVRHTEIPWRSITEFRNRLAHGYLDVDPVRVWEVISEDLPILKVVVAAELRRARHP